MANRMPNVWMPDEGLMRSPHPASSRRFPAKPVKRVRKVSAVVICVPTVVALVLFFRYIAASRHVVGTTALSNYAFADFLR